MSEPELVPMPTTGDFNPFLSGPRIFLRDVRPQDVNDDYCGWMNDPEVTRYLESRFVPQGPESIRAFVAGLQGSRDNVFLAIVLRDGGRHIGNIKLGPIEWVHRRAEIGLLIGDKASWGKGYATEAIQVVTDYAFERLNLHKVTAGCYAPNVGSLRAFEKAGFVREGLFKDHSFLDGAYVDGIRLGRLRTGS